MATQVQRNAPGRPDRPGGADSAAPTPGAPVHVADSRRHLRGYAHGLRQPVLLASLHIPPAQARLRMGELRAVFSALDMKPPGPPAVAGEPDLARLVRIWAEGALRKTGHPVFEASRYLGPAGGGAHDHLVALPCLDAGAARAALAMAAEWIGRCVPAGSGAPDAAALKRDMAVQLKRLAASAPRGFNMIHFLRAAHDMDAPWALVGPDVYQVGWGSRSRWLSSSFTDATGVIASTLARDKRGAAQMLRACALPVPEHATVRDEEAALAQAQRLGYPVVVKPADQDGGVGVSAWLADEHAVRAAYAAARKHSRRVLVEKHVFGRDYRIHVVDGVVHGLLERVPGSVTGDGRSTVQALLERQNLERRTVTDDRRFLKEMELDAEAQRMLGVQGLAPGSVPADGQTVRLRAAANVTSGGVPVPVEPGLAHPDNLELAVRAARVLRLDVAGIDLLIPDIAVSWLQSGAAICEVNAQPQMFTTMHAPMLRSLLGPGMGRIPVVIVVDDDPAASTARAIHDSLRARGLNSGLCAGESVWLGDRAADHCVARGSFSAMAGASALLRDRKTDALVLQVSFLGAVRQDGWPVDRCDALVWAGTDALMRSQPQRLVAAWAGFAKDLRPAATYVTRQAAAQLVQAGVAAAALPAPVSAADASAQAERAALAQAVLAQAAPVQATPVTARPGPADVSPAGG